jgi:hypothetical protein
MTKNICFPESFHENICKTGANMRGNLTKITVAVFAKMNYVG